MLIHGHHFYLQGIKKYFKLGLGLEIARNLIYNYGLILKNPLKIFHVFVSRLNWNLVLFLVGYVGIYRVSIDLCILFYHQNNVIWQYFIFSLSIVGSVDAIFT